MSFATVSSNKAFGGTQGVYSHRSEETGTDMTFSVFVPDHAPGEKLPVLAQITVPRVSPMILQEHPLVQEIAVLLQLGHELSPGMMLQK